MNTYAVDVQPLAQSVQFTDRDIVVELVDGRTVSVPLAWFPRLRQATPTELHNFELLADGEGIHWPDIDEDLSVGGLLRGETGLRS
jgi:hypothetical protein